MKSKNRRELALMQVEKARKNIELVFDLLYTDEEIEDYYDEYRSLMITEAGIVIVSKSETVTPISFSSLTEKEIEAIYKQIKELEQC